MNSVKGLVDYEDDEEESKSGEEEIRSHDRVRHVDKRDKRGRRNEEPKPHPHQVIIGSSHQDKSNFKNVNQHEREDQVPSTSHHGKFISRKEKDDRDVREVREHSKRESSSSKSRNDKASSKDKSDRHDYDHHSHSQSHHRSSHKHSYDHKKHDYHSHHHTSRDRRERESHSHSRNDRNDRNDSKRERSERQRSSRREEENRKIETKKEKEVVESVRSESNVKTAESKQNELMKTLEAVHEHIKEKTGVEIPKYYNPTAINAMKYAEQAKKRKLLWSRGDEEKDKPQEEVIGTNKSSTASNLWNNLKFSGDQGNIQTEKFRKLMGIKGQSILTSTSTPSTHDSRADNESHMSSAKTLTSTNTEKIDLEKQDPLKSQNVLFEQLDMQYSIARMSTHTHRGLGLGFGSASSSYSLPSSRESH